MNRVAVLNRPSTVERGTEVKPSIIYRVALLACAAFMASSSLLMAQAGKLDTTFGTGGVFLDSSGEFDNSGTFGNVVALQNDGKIVAAGQIGFGAGVLRLNANGTLDSSFGTGGMVTINFPGSNLGATQVIGVAIQPDGKIVAGISNANADATPLFILARLNVNASLDTTFGSAGIVETQIGSFGKAASVFSLQLDGKILLAGNGGMARYDTDGQLDDTFGSGGVVAIGGSPTAIALQPDGKILIAAGGSPPGNASSAPGLAFAFASVAGAISRYNTNGSIDASFGISGQAASLAVAAAIAVQSDGVCVSTCKLLVAGPIVSSLSIDGGNGIGFGLVRYSSNGSLDTSFGKHGGVITSFTPIEPLAAAFALALQSNGDIIAAGTTGQPPGGSASNFMSQADFALARYTSSGAMDTTFGSGGRVTTAFGANEAGIYALALQSDGKIVAAGSSQQNPFGGQVGGFVVARYLAQ
jgi:uncharacterized delta-60 repeat protein